MKFDALLGPSDTMVSPKAEIQRAINCFRIPVETGQGIGPYFLSRTPGLTPLVQPNAGKFINRGSYFLNGHLFQAIDDTMYDLVGNGSTIHQTYPGMANDGLPVRMAASQTSLMAISGGTLYRFDGVNISQPTIAFTPIGIAYLGTYFWALASNNQQFYFSSDDGVTWQAGNVESAEEEANNLLAIIAHQDTLFVYGNKITQPFVIVANANAPAAKQGSGVIQVGIEAIDSLDYVGDYRYWLGTDASGRLAVYQGTAYSYVPVSNLGLDNAMRTYIKNFGTVSDAIGHGYHLNGMDFYDLTFPSADASWRLNITVTMQTGVGEWSEVRAWNYTTQQYHRHRANTIVAAFDQILVGDYQNGWLYVLDPDNYTDFGYPQRGERRAPHVMQDGKNVFYDELELACEVGVGLTSPLWLQNYSLSPSAFATALASAVSMSTVTAAQAVVLQQIYNGTPYTPLNPYPSPDTMNSLGFFPWGAPTVLANGTTVLGGPPTISRAYSNDGGLSFNMYQERSLGKAGETRKRVRWQRESYARDRVYDFIWDHPCRMNIMTGWLNGPEEAGS